MSHTRAKKKKKKKKVVGCHSLPCLQVALFIRHSSILRLFALGCQSINYPRNAELKKCWIDRHTDAENSFGFLSLFSFGLVSSDIPSFSVYSHLRAQTGRISRHLSTNFVTSDSVVCLICLSLPIGETNDSKNELCWENYGLNSSAIINRFNTILRSDMTV